ncbi:hypothetical protein M404DRAFT_996336 [Pisolithus tinctorius Marx 270]|uniref:Uncharacterized protein n=1 Tax=Pisolithus tinctorius Marx 270 TaxID=870435 RepID=A0A0C3JK18_PISTI|nr:hypothetical protein M404DRAFT_996336 [Pisolithus tinctorius Marx 270]
MKIDERAGDLSKEQGDSTNEKLAPAASEPPKPSNSSEETTATTMSAGKSKDKKRREKKSRSKNTTDNKVGDLRIQSTATCVFSHCWTSGHSEIGNVCHHH